MQNKLQSQFSGPWRFATKCTLEKCCVFSVEIYVYYCKLHLLYAYQPKGKKDDVTDKDEVPEFIEKKIKSA